MDERMKRDSFDIVEDALRSYPLSAAPPTLAPAVLARIRAMERPMDVLPAPRFGLMWIDYALGLFGVGMAGLALLLWQSWLPDWLVQFVLPDVVPADPLSVALVLGGTAGGLAVLAGCLVVAALVLEPQSIGPWPFVAGQDSGR